MNNFKEAFNQIQASNKLKQHTKEYVYQKTNRYTLKRKVYSVSFAFACLLLMFFTGSWLYFTPTLAISIDINPSMQLDVNRFGKIISTKSNNEDADKVIDELNIKYMNYHDAITQIIENEQISLLLENDEIMTITVIGDDEKQCSEIYSNIQILTEKEKNMECYSAHSDEIEKAHHMGLSYGKYKALLEIQALDSSITSQQIENMTMKEIKELIHEMSNDKGNGHGHGHKNQ